MSRIRSIHPGLWTDERFVSVSPFARLLFMGLLNECDDYGSFEWSPLKLKMRLLPADGVDAPALLAELAEIGSLLRYEVDGKAYGAVRNFCQYQRPKKPASSYPQTDEVRNFVNTDARQVRDGSEPVGNQLPTSPEKSRQRKDEGGNRSSEANASGGDAAEPDPKKVLFDAGVALLTSQGETERGARSFIGKLAKDHGGPRTMEVLTAAVADAKADAKAWMVSQLRPAKPAEATEHEQTLIDWIAARQPRMRPDERLEWARNVLRPIAGLPASAIGKGLRDAFAEKPRFVNEVPDLIATKAREWARLDAAPVAKPRPPDAAPPADPVSPEQMAALRQSIGKTAETMRAA